MEERRDGRLGEKEWEVLLAHAERAAWRAKADRDIAHDAATMAVLALEERLDQVSTELRARKAWVATTAKRNAKRMGQRADRQKPFGRQGSELPRLLDDGNEDLVNELVKRVVADARRPSRQRSPSEEVASGMNARAALERLPPDDLELLRLRFLEQRTAKEVAEELDIEPAAVDKRVQRAKHRLRKLMEEGA